MVNLQTIRQSIIKIDYGFNNPKSLLVLCPGVSLICQKIQMGALIETLENRYHKPHKIEEICTSDEFYKIRKICKWHLLGSLIQTISLLFLANVQPLFLIPAAISLYQAFSSFNGISRESIRFTMLTQDVYRCDINR